MKKIALLTDFSDTATKSYRIASSLARSKDASITLFHQCREAESGDIPVASLDYFTEIQKRQLDIKSEAKVNLNEVRALSIFENLSVDISLLEYIDGINIQSVVNKIEKESCDLIILGTSGHENQRNSFSDMVIESAKIPVLVCKNELGEFHLNRILIPTDLETFSASFFKKIEDLCLPETQKTMLYVNTKQHFLTDGEIESKFKFLVKKYHINNCGLKVLNSSSVHESILKECDPNKHDLVCLATEGKTGISKFLFGSVTEKIAAASPIPTFSVNLHDYLDEKDSGNGSSFRSAFTG